MMASFLSGSPLIVCLFLSPFRVIAENSSTQLMTQAARVLPFHDRFVLDYQGNGIGLNLTITLLTRHKQSLDRRQKSVNGTCRQSIIAYIALALSVRDDAIDSQHTRHTWHIRRAQHVMARW